jgi:hypothetical protein
LVAVVLGDRDDEAQVRLDHPLLRRPVAALDQLGELDLLRGGEQRVAPGLAQEELERVVVDSTGWTTTGGGGGGSSSAVSSTTSIAALLELAVDAVRLERVERSGSSARSARLPQRSRCSSQIEVSRNTRAARSLMQQLIDLDRHLV